MDSVIDRAAPELQEAKDAAISLVLAAIIHHHPNRELVLDELRKLHVIAPSVAGNPALSAEINAKCNETFQDCLKAIREAERKF
jgi:hypothetical protein